MLPRQMMTRVAPIRIGTALLGAFLLVACSDSLPLRPDALSRGEPNASSAPQQAVQRYVVVLNPDPGTSVSTEAVRLTALFGGQSVFVYQAAIRGFAVDLDPAVAAALAADPSVDYVEADQAFSIVATQLNPPSWGLDRVDQRALPLDNSFTHNASGVGVTAYILDTGIRTTHNDFGGRARGGFTSINDGNGTNDCNGHGTHVAGTVGGTAFGVAKSVDLVAVRVLDCAGFGTTSGVIAGVDFVTQDVGNSGTLPAVANMSLSGPPSTALDQAVQNSISAGISYSVSAGNQAIDACQRSPARLAAALTVAASDIQDRRAGFSNTGTCVDLYAPGVSITSAWHTSNGATAVVSGTSQASPHVAGTAAQFLQGSPGASAGAVASAITGNATSGAIANPGSNTPNLLLYTGFIGGGPPPPIPPVNPVGPYTVQIVALRATDADLLIDWNTVPDATSYHVYAPGFQGGPQPFNDMVPHPTSQHTVTVQRQVSDWDLAVRVTPHNSAGGGQRTIEVITIPAR